MNEEALAEFIRTELESNKDVIEELSDSQIQHLIETETYVVAIAYSLGEDCEHCAEALVQLESIDDDAEAVGIRFGHWSNIF